MLNALPDTIIVDEPALCLSRAGIISIGPFASILTEATGWSEQFPGVKASLLGLRVVTMIPFSRELFMACGLCDVSAESCSYILEEGRRAGGGRAIGIVIGGAKEALDARPGVMKLTLAERKGFVKVALRHGCDFLLMSCGVLPNLSV